jgi:uncharacterized repeat protein (TIGR01451 family)
LWFTENTSNEIGRISTAGAVTEITVPTANAGPTGITAGSDGALWFTEATAGQVGRITTTGAITEISAGVNPDGGLAGIAFGPDRNLWFTEATAAQIGRVALSADLAVTKTDGMATVAPGTIVTYTIVVSSAAASDPVERVTVSDSFSAALTLVSWTAMFAGGASGTPSGNGNILEVVKLPAGGTVTYTVVGTVSAAAFGSLVNTVSLLPSVPDPNPANNSATDTDTITVQAIVTGTGPGGGPHVKAFNAQTGALLRSFFAYDSTFAGGVRVAFGDVNGDGVPDIITSPGAGGGPHVKAFDGFSGALIASFFA